MGFTASINAILYGCMGQGSPLSVLVRRVHVEVSKSRFEVEGISDDILQYFDSPMWTASMFAQCTGMTGGGSLV